MVKTFAELMAGLPDAHCLGSADVGISEVTSDSRTAGPGSVFVAVKGTGGDGHHFLTKAIAQGCVAVVHQEALDEYLSESEISRLGASLRVSNTRPLPALLARELYDRPDLKLLTAAVTGTNGKTTVSFLLREMLNRLQGPCGLLGTICYDDGVRSVPAPLTTPGGPDFFHWLQQMATQGCGSVAMELSSHALDQDRTTGLSLSVAVMTNIGRDHLDYHQNISRYVAAKAKILDLLKPGAPVVINAREELLMDLETGGHPVLLFDPKPQLRGSHHADLLLTRAELGLAGSHLELDFQGQSLVLDSPLVGRFNVENLMAAFNAGVALGFSPQTVIAALAGVDQVPGRLERLDLPVGALAVVDYAHTHDALEAVLLACDELSSGRLLLVFGCGGDRDKGKRPLMGQTAASHADAVWITSDNPRSEDPAAICQEIEAGFRSVKAARAETLQVIEDRTSAVRSALSSAGPGDIVVVAGKGHEDYQLVGEKVLDLDDRQLIRDWIVEEGTHG